MTPAEAAIRERHWQVPLSGVTLCGRDEEVWPCDAIQALALLDAERAEVARLDVARADAFRRGRERERASILVAVEERQHSDFASEGGVLVRHDGPERAWIEVAAVLAAIEGADRD